MRKERKAEESLGGGQGKGWVGVHLGKSLQEGWEVQGKPFSLCTGGFLEKPPHEIAVFGDNHNMCLAVHMDLKYQTLTRHQP